ncbi:SulP family inorganic anion transporter [Actinocorallia longicatena]|uniref:SulP family inorganic anion transporter n=1 Tax=Actinocorallia longicatena TaxID=111803 RepID=UPI0031DEE6D9
MKGLGRPTGRDAVAGLVTGLFSIPEGMAYASIGGFSPVLGLFSGVAPTIVGALLARTVLMVTTLTSAIALSSQSVLSEAGLDPHDTGNVVTLTLLVGVVMLLFGLLKFGAAMSFVSNAVMTGFTTGIALQIITGSLKDATGYKPRGHNKLWQIVDWITHIGSWQASAVLVSAVTVAVWAAAHTVPRLESTATLLALLIVTVGVTALGTDVELVRDIARVPSSLPSITIPDLSAAPHLLLGAAAVALVALAQAAGIGAAVPNPDGSRTDMNRDFTAQGAANLAGAFLQALPTGGSLSRTGVATGAGARTRWAGVFAGLWLALIVLVAGKYTEYIPMPVIGGLIIVVGGEIILGRIPDIRLVAHTGWQPLAAMAVTFLATTQLPLQQAIILGAVLSLILYCVSVARQSRLLRLVPGDEPNTWQTSPAGLPDAIGPGDVVVLTYQGVSFFAELNRINEHWPRLPGDATGATLILVLRTVPDVPSSTLVKALHKHAHALQQAGGTLALVGVQPGLRHLLDTTGTTEVIGAANVYPAGPGIFQPLDRAFTDAVIRARR